MNFYDIGETVTVTGTFRNTSGTLTDPTTVTCTVTRPDETTTSATMSSSSTGIWTGTITATAAGLWWYRITGTDPVGNTVEEGVFTVRRQRA